MRKDFLEIIAEHIFSKYTDRFNRISVIFPSRRATVFFKNCILKISREYESKSFWMPEVLSISDFITKYSDFKTGNPLELNFILYDVYKKYFPNESFDGFYKWGEIIIRDFDIIDKYLAPPLKIFKSIKDIKEIEEIFPAELTEDYKNFWLNIKNEDTEEKKEFLKLWQMLFKIYQDFNDILLKKRTGYEGMIYKYFFRNLLGKQIGINKNKIIFAGLNMLSPSELGIIIELIKANKCEVHFNADKYFYDSEKQESGKHIRNAVWGIEKAIEDFGQERENILFLHISDTLAKSEKNISVISSTGQVGMTKALGNILEEFSGNFRCDENTTIILPDESLLPQVLSSIPDNIKYFNITMGYPFTSTLLYSFLVLLNKMHSTAKYISGEIQYYLPSVQKILLHPFMKFENTGKTYELVNLLVRKNIIYLNPLKNNVVKEILGEELPLLFKTVFSYPADNNEFIHYMKEIIGALSKKLENVEENDRYVKFQSEFLNVFYNNFKVLSNCINSRSIDISTGTFRKLIEEIISNVRVPFAGEPLKGMQIMGILETRCLDFDNLFFLSLNEGVFPKPQNDTSFIPFVIRKYFRIPTYEDDDSISSYYFYNLFKNGKNIFLFFDNDSDNLSQGRSRFLLQIEKELIRINKNISYSEKNISPPVKTFGIKPIAIEKTGDVIKMTGEIKKLSASGIITFITCPLKFYFKYVLGFKEPDVIEEDIKDNTFGSVLHEIMKMLYKPFEGKQITGDIPDIIIKKTESEYDKIFQKALEEVSRKHKRIYSMSYSPKNPFLKKVIRELVLLVLHTDKSYTPLDIVSLEKYHTREKKLECNGKKYDIILHGFIDRIDITNGITRIIDYKTGGEYIRSLSTRTQDNFFTKLFTDISSKDSFQTFFYSYLYSKDYKSGIIPVVYYVNGKELKTKYVKDVVLTADDFSLFEKELDSTLQNIFSSEIPFMATEDTANCSYCPFRELCHR